MDFVERGKMWLYSYRLRKKYHEMGKLNPDGVGVTVILMFEISNISNFDPLS